MIRAFDLGWDLFPKAVHTPHPPSRAPRSAENGGGQIKTPGHIRQKKTDVRRQ